MINITRSEHVFDGVAGLHAFAIVGGSPLAAALRRQVAVLGMDACSHDLDARLPTLSEVARYDTVFATDDDAAVVAHLNEMCLLASVNYVVVGAAANAVWLDTYPFALAQEIACHACHPRAATVAATPDRGREPLPTEERAAGLAIAHGLPDVRREQSQSRRLLDPAPGGHTDGVVVSRDPSCTTCAAVTGSPRLVHPRNRWSSPGLGLAASDDALGQLLLLSDAIVTGATCVECGELPAREVTGLVNRRASGPGTVAPKCPRCSGPALRLTSRREFSVGELVARFGVGAVPVRYALAHIGTTTVCFDLGAGRTQAPDYSVRDAPASTGSGVGGAAGPSGATVRPDGGSAAAGAGTVSTLSTK